VVPSTWLSVFLFLFLIAPGLLFDLLAERRRAGAKESAFRETSRVILASFAFSGLGLAVLALVRTWAPSLMPDPRRLLNHGGTYFAGHYRLVAVALLVELGVAVGAASAVHAFLARGTGAGLRPISTWKKVLRDECPAGYVPHVRVRLDDDIVYLGRLGHFTADLDQADRELVLVPPLFAKSGDKALAAMPEEWQRVVVHASNVHSMAVQYRPAGDP
jgi:hypothetical protein